MSTGPYSGKIKDSFHNHHDGNWFFLMTHTWIRSVCACDSKDGLKPDSNHSPHKTQALTPPLPNQDLT
ncbi:hypothetical protein E2C01_021347 [Portunus trituberculatus]|uniref:Uncharacterized protein n=1 Tax=Portunus trituberculatus TaxID=210409 RepID=A0A5B7E299_PORTR|nr:hypothetical protein [Portunus trituberculatus]